MTQFSIGGELLELPSDLKLQFTKKNILFAFDEIECERSLSFNIPATPKNDRIFNFSREAATYGDGMRRRYDAQMQNGIITKRGYLYVESYAGGDYKAIFVTGELLGLLALKNAGTIKDLYQTGAFTPWANTVDASSAIGQLWKCVRYAQKFQGECFPSVEIHTIVEELCRNLGATSGQILSPAGVSDPKNDYLHHIRVIPAKLEGYTQTFRVVSKPNVPANANDYANVIEDYDNMPFFFEPVDIIAQSTLGRVWRDSMGVGYEPYGSVYNVFKFRGYKAKSDIEITFPVDFPSNYTLVRKLEPYFLGGTLSLLNGIMYGGIDIYNPGTGDTMRVEYANLAGQTISIAKNTEFAFFNINDVSYDRAIRWITGDVREPFIYENNENKYIEHGQPAYDLRFDIKLADVVAGGDIYLKPNLPDITLVDMLKTEANMFGWVLYYTDEMLRGTTGIHFEDLTDIDDWPVINLSGKVIKVDDLQRRFGGYAQNNRVLFDNEDYLWPIENTEVNYTVPNDCIDKDKTLYTIPFNEGGIQADDRDNPVNPTFNILLMRNDQSQDGQKNTIAMAADTDKYLGRPLLSKNMAIQNLCTQSTSIKISARMAQFEFETIKPKTVIWYAGVRYVWTEASWSNNVATLKLSKI